MTTQSDSLKTSEFLRRRKLRLQQVREQSKDIAKKIRQRAKTEQLKHTLNVDSAKEAEYLHRQEKLVNRLEQLYTKGLQNVGASHKNASAVNNEDIPEKKDLSKLRGREAVAELRRKRQDKLDEQKKLLDRKLQAREIANELSREKSAVIHNLMKSSSSKSIECGQSKSLNNIEENASKGNDNGESVHENKSETVAKSDMGTQWEFEEIPHEWEPNIPPLSLPKDDSVKNSANNNVDKADKNKRPNLFALSDEMPSSLRGHVPSIPEDKVPSKPSLTLVSEYLQNRGLRLRESDTTSFQKKSMDELQSIKQTLLRTRASRTDGSVFTNICHVLDEQVIPVPSWEAGNNYQFNTRKLCHEHHPFHHRWNPKDNRPSTKCATNIRPVLQDFPVHLKYPMQHRCQNVPNLSVSGRSNNTKLNKSIDPGSAMSKKNSVTIYNHSTRDSRDLRHNVHQMVVRDHNRDDDAYSQALKEASVVEPCDQEHQRTVQQETRNRIAVTKQNVDKEYRDTLAFLNSLPKERPARSIKTAYMDGERQQHLKEKHQQKLQQEFKKIEKECSKHHCQHAKPKSQSQRSKSKSPLNFDMDYDTNKEFQYSWMPVPDRDGSLAIHTIPNNSKDKSANTVKFSSVDTYHEYRSRHKHTPPTKDTCNDTNKRVVEAVIIHESSNDSIDSSSGTDTSSVDGLQSNVNNMKSSKNNKHISDAERIIIYKVMETKKSKKHKCGAKSDFRNKGHKEDNNNTEDAVRNVIPNVDRNDNVSLNNVSITQLKEGVYKSVSTNGDNVASMYFLDNPQENQCNHDKDLSSAMLNGDGTGVNNNQYGDNSINRSLKDDSCKCKSNKSHKNDKCKSTMPNPSAATSTSSFQTASNDKANSAGPEGGYIKFVDDGGQEAGKFYVGASGFLKDDAYEVIIQLRKKEAENNNLIQDSNAVNKNIVLDKVIENNDINLKTSSVQPIRQSISKTNSGNDELQDHLTAESLANNNTSSISVPPHVGSPTCNVLHQDQVIDQDDINTNNIQKTKADAPIIADKAVGTSFQDSYAIPENVPKTDPIKRPATSTYTQTTHNSPISRPVLMHLSSSTSTTYMSPPELVLPRFLRKGNSETCEDTYEPLSSNRNSEYIRHGGLKHCECDKCKRNIGIPSRRMERTEYTNAETPPNSTRSTNRNTEKFNNEQHYTCYSEYHNIRRKGKSHTCKNRKQSKICSKHKLKRGSSGNKSHNHLSKHLRNNKTITGHAKTNLNPVIEKYVKKLLALNKEGLKAINVVNQECSAVTTPGSSIIDLRSNTNKNEPTISNKISLEQIKNTLKEQILKDVEKCRTYSKCSVTNMASQTESNLIPLVKSRKRAVHKVKSLNISKHLLKTKRMNHQQSAQSTIFTTSPYSGVSTNVHKYPNSVQTNSFNINSSIPKQVRRGGEQSSYNSSNSYTSKDYVKPFQCIDKIKVSQTDIRRKTPATTHAHQAGVLPKCNTYSFPSHRATVTTNYSESEVSDTVLSHKDPFKLPVTTSTQTIHLVDSEVEFMKLAEDKIQNMEKIADLTEKCTKRLSNLAKVLEEVRKNKSLAYSQISTTDASDSDQRSDKINKDRVAQALNVNPDIQTLTEPLSSLPISPVEENNNVTNSSSYMPILLDLPQPESFKTISPVSTFSDNVNIHTSSDKADVTSDHSNTKARGKPPPALTRMNLKHVSDAYGVPHELSTVLEVDSPMSVKLKSHTSRLETKYTHSPPETLEHKFNETNEKNEVRSDEFESHKEDIDPDMHQSKASICISKNKCKTASASDESKLKMMDLKQFNEIMLKPFISLQEYAKQCNLEEPGGSSLDGILKDEHVNEELSSLRSEGSLPDVVAELLKRNLISEPFKFETTSNPNSTSISSESTLSMLALSRVRKEKKKSSILLKNKENVAETSESLSMSSNPDLENAFQKLGMGWASSTLKKTKERLALSSSSNTSGSSIAQAKFKTFNYNDIPPLSKDSISSILNITNKQALRKSQFGSASEISKNAVQQTSLTNSMTVKEFLTNELAKSITFTNKSNKNATDGEFVSLYETKLPEEVQHLSHKIQDNEKSLDSGPNITNNRARTSTPVQIFKSTTYHSTSSSNTSNGLFSNADELSSVKHTSNSNKNHSTSEKDDLTIPNYSLKMRKGQSDCSKSD